MISQNKPCQLFFCVSLPALAQVGNWGSARVCGPEWVKGKSYFTYFTIELNPQSQNGIVARISNETSALKSSLNHEVDWHSYPKPGYLMSVQWCHFQGSLRRIGITSQ